MSLERLQYEQDWDEFVRCKCRRPMREMKKIQDSWVCVDERWCNKMVLAKEEEAALTLKAPPKKPRSKSS
jgi:hypothetical protein